MTMLALLVSVAFAANAAVPLETQSADSLRDARRQVVSGKRGRGLATLDSLVMSDGVTVSVESSNAMEPSVARGIEAWNDALKERAFRMKPAGTTADVTVRFVRNLDAMGGDVQGMVDATREISWSERTHAYRLKATIYVRDNVEGRRLRPEEVTNVVAHETGHLLGLADVQQENRLMGPMVVGHPKSGPTPEEAVAVCGYRAMIRRCYPKP